MEPWLTQGWHRAELGVQPLHTRFLFFSYESLLQEPVSVCGCCAFLLEFPCFSPVTGFSGCSASDSLLSYCLPGLRGDLSHHTRPNLFWIVANVAIFVLLEVNFSHEHQIQSNILKAARWCQAPKLCHRQDLPQLGPRLHQGSMHSI